MNALWDEYGTPTRKQPICAICEEEVRRENLARRDPSVGGSEA